MVELSNERIEQILHEETPKTEELATILRGIYIRYMWLYEGYFDDIDSLNDDKISEFRKYQEETKSLIKYYYMDIPYDICEGLIEFDNEYNAKLLGVEWHKYLFDSYNEYKKKNKSKNKSEECIKAAFAKEILESFYETMSYVLRSAFDTESETASQAASGFGSLLFGE